ncbi:oxygen-dependent protoporphyrinogen oxidase [Myotisia sp. PD_48]|nr:oxygen-dependent protoporphyrinogen oxidase [Myotisia sp. PD_48]
MGRRCLSTRALAQSRSLTCQSQQQLQRRCARFASSSPIPPKIIAVIGGGLTGLSTAFFLARHPHYHIVIFEKSDTLGGHVRSESIPLDGGHVIFENGPRTLRSSGTASLPVLDLITQLNLESQVITKSIHSAASRNKYIYYPDGLMRIPAALPGASKLVSYLVNGLNVLSHPPLLNAIWQFIYRYIFPLGRPRHLDSWGEPDESYTEFCDRTRGKVAAGDRWDAPDESVTEYSTRVLGKDATDIFTSAFIHGIYAGDIDKLSARAIVGYNWDLGDYPWKSKHNNWSERCMSKDTYDAMECIIRDGRVNRTEKAGKLITGTSVYTLAQGLGSITAELEKYLSEKSNVTIARGLVVSRIRQEESGPKLKLEYPGHPGHTFDFVVSTTPATVLADQLRDTTEGSPNIESDILSSHNYAVNVMSVNLFYRETHLVPVQGFGYLIPRSVPLDQNPERGLGVIFMSQLAESQDTVPGTKLTVMLGGHWWDGWEEGDLPDEETGIEMAKSLLKRHLGITKEPAIARASLLRNAIPQYTVGHINRMKNLGDILTFKYGSRLKVAGAWYSGVGMTDCVTGARIAAGSIHLHHENISSRVGLEKYTVLGRSPWPETFYQARLQVAKLQNRLEKRKNKA